MTRLYLHQTNDRRLASDYAGDVLLWDIDKTYLDTRFSSVRGLLGIPFELAVDKTPIIGSVSLLRALRRGPGPQPALVPLYFVSGSPVQLRRVIEQRMTLDGVQFDGVTFKDQLGLLRAGRLTDLTRQVGYKLAALLLYARALPIGARWLMFGDDVEQDAEIFALFGEVCAGLRGGALVTRLREQTVHPRDIAAIEAIVAELTPRPDPVERIFIHRTRTTSDVKFSDARVVATRSYLQSALVLAHWRKIAPEVIGTLAKELRHRGVLDVDIEAQVSETAREWHVSADLVELAAC
ncbi:MAG: phosphatase domain-containing protein [Myxococcota bacterium]